MKTITYEQAKEEMLARYKYMCEAVEDGDEEQIIALLTCSVYSTAPRLSSSPVLDDDLCFKYRGYTFELASCTNITSWRDVSEARKPLKLHDRYVCWMYGHIDIDGHRLPESLIKNPKDPDVEIGADPVLYLVPGAWAHGIDDLEPGNCVSRIILGAIDEFLDNFEEVEA